MLIVNKLDRMYRITLKIEGELAVARRIVCQEGCFVQTVLAKSATRKLVIQLLGNMLHECFDVNAGAVPRLQLRCPSLIASKDNLKHSCEPILQPNPQRT